jgi:hypothetical protein
VKRYKSTTILGGGPPGKIVQCQSFCFYLEKIKIKENNLSVRKDEIENVDSKSKILRPN